jgi:hypothetical protein
MLLTMQTIHKDMKCMLHAGINVIMLCVQEENTHFMTEASLRNSLRSLSVACSFTVLIAQRISG